MPPRSVTIDIRDAAQQKIKASAAILSDRFGIAFPGAVGFEGRDLDYLRARELESIAGFLESLANEPEVDETKALKVKLAQSEKEVENLTGEAVLLRAEIENLTAAWQEAETKLQWFDGIVGALQKLLWTSVENDGLRDALVAVDFIQAIYSEGKGWTVSVIGLGVDLDAISADGHSLTGDDAPEIPAGLLNAPTAPVDLSRMNRASLNEYATSLGIVDVESFATKAELIATIEAIRK